MHIRGPLPVRRGGGLQVRRQPIRRASPRLRSTQIWALVAMVLCIAGVAALGTSKNFGAHKLEVHGARFSGEQVIGQIVGLDAAPNLFRLRTDQVATKILALPAVQSVHVEIHLPDTVVVDIVERAPRLVWVLGEHRYVVDEAGMLFGEVDAAGNPLPLTAVPTPRPSGRPSASPSEPAEPSAEATDTAEASATDTTEGAARATKTPVRKPTPTPKRAPTPRPTASPSPTPAPTGAAAPPSLEPVPTPDSAELPGPSAVDLPTVFDRRAISASFGLGDFVDPISLDAAYRLANLSPADVGSRATDMAVVLDDIHGFTLASAQKGWVAEFGFYTATLRKDTVIPEQVRDLRSLMLQYGEDQVAWVFLMADISDSHINTLIPK